MEDKQLKQGLESLVQTAKGMAKHAELLPDVIEQIAKGMPKEVQDEFNASKQASVLSESLQNLKDQINEFNETSKTL